MSNQLIIFYSLKKNNLYLYNIPLINEGSRLRQIYIQDGTDIIDLDLDLKDLDWDSVTENTDLKQVFNDYNGEIIALY